MDSAAARVFPAWRVMSGMLVCLAYPTRPRGSHKGVPLRVHCCSASGVNEFPFPGLRGDSSLRRNDRGTSLAQHQSQNHSTNFLPYWVCENMIF